MNEKPSLFKTFIQILFHDNRKRTMFYDEFKINKIININQIQHLIKNTYF